MQPAQGTGSFAALAELPQLVWLGRLLPVLAGHPAVAAVWLGGSFAAGTADGYSDVDLRIAVPGAELSSWRTPDFAALFGQPPLAANFLPFGEDGFLHHLLLADGTLFDFFVQSTARHNPEPAIHILACRDESFRTKLESFRASPPVPALAGVPTPADTRNPIGTPAWAGGAPSDPGITILQLLVDFWIVSFKHTKVLARDLPLLATFGLAHERTTLLRLIHLDLTGTDPGPRLSIHGFTAATQTLQARLGPAAQALLGLPLRTREEVIHAIETHRDEVSCLTRSLRSKFGFAAPGALEETVRTTWAAARLRGRF